MRIIAGRWRGRPLVAPAGDSTRPTADRTRETLFSMLVSRLGSFDGLAVADLFAGSGALGLEALSRGASSCLLVERDRAALDAIRANVAGLGADGATVTAGDAERVSSHTPFDIVFLDPPYGSGAAGRAIVSLLDRGLLAPGALVTIETAAKEAPPAPQLELEAERVTGRAHLWIYRSSPPLGSDTRQILGASAQLDG